MANTYINRNFSNSGNRTIWTLSMWVKRSKIGAEQMLAHAYQGSNDYTKIRFESDDILTFENYTGGSRNIAKRTNRMFRDTNAFYHFVFVNTPSAQTIYVNGVQETSWRTNTTGNVSTWWNHNISNTMFATVNGGSNYFDGIASHVHFCDGTALAPTVFGETDSTTGEWKIKTAPSFTLGTNGFTILKDGNTITDQSANSNNFSLGGGTITVTKDCPDNVFATLNPLMPLGSNIAYSNGNLTITPGTSDYKTTASSIAVGSGKFYTEFKAVSGHNGSTDVSIGIVGADTFLASTGSKAMSAYTNAFSYGSGGLVKQYNGSTIRTDATYTNGDIIGIAVDMDNLKLYWSKNGTFQNSGNPASGSTGTGAVSIPSGQPYYICATTISSGGVKVFSANFGNGFFGTTAITTNSGNGYAGADGKSKFNYAVPSGYSALSTKGLNI